MNTKIIEEKVKELKHRIPISGDEGDLLVYWKGYEEAIDVSAKAFLDLISTTQQEERERLIKKYKPVLNDMYATQWLRDFGLDDNDTLNAGEVEELLQQFIYDHSSNGEEKKPSNYLLEMLKKTSKQKEKGEVSRRFDNAEDAIKWLND